MVQGASQIALIYRIYYKCLRTNLNAQALDKRRPRETTLIQTTNPRSNIQVPKTLQWLEVTFPENWTLKNENYPLQIQDPARNPDLDLDLALTSLGLDSPQPWKIPSLDPQ